MGCLLLILLFVCSLWSTLTMYPGGFFFLFLLLVFSSVFVSVPWKRGPESKCDSDEIGYLDHCIRPIFSFYNHDSRAKNSEWLWEDELPITVSTALSIQRLNVKLVLRVGLQEMLRGHWYKTDSSSEWCKSSGVCSYVRGWTCIRIFCKVTKIRISASSEQEYLH